ncbi:MAG: AlpA family phage regulatory protein [Bacteroidetes bacterium]|nr:AlpA family phage regulatory protein [Bacteroidota bacterium]MDA3037841.1 AlpA family phage regulatory protein [Actinomycetota bacterium]
MGLFEHQTYVNGKEILKFFGVTSETIKDWMKNKNFPKPITPSPKTRLWKCSEIDNWLTEIRKDQHDQYNDHYRYHDDGEY